MLFTVVVVSILMRKVGDTSLIGIYYGVVHLFNNDVVLIRAIVITDVESVHKTCQTGLY